MDKLKSALVAGFFALTLTGVGMAQEEWQDEPMDQDVQEQEVEAAQMDIEDAAMQQGWEENDIEAAKDVHEDLVNENVDPQVARDEIVMRIEQGQTIDEIEQLTEEERVEELRQREPGIEEENDDAWPLWEEEGTEEPETY